MEENKTKRKPKAKAGRAAPKFKRIKPKFRLSENREEENSGENYATGITEKYIRKTARKVIETDPVEEARRIRKAAKKTVDNAKKTAEASKEAAKKTVKAAKAVGKALYEAGKALAELIKKFVQWLVSLGPWAVVCVVIIVAGTIIVSGIYLFAAPDKGYAYEYDPEKELDADMRYRIRRLYEVSGCEESSVTGRTADFDYVVAAYFINTSFSGKIPEITPDTYYGLSDVYFTVNRIETEKAVWYETFEGEIMGEHSALYVTIKPMSTDEIFRYYGYSDDMTALFNELIGLEELKE